MPSVFLLNLITEDTNRGCTFVGVEGVYSTKEIAERRGHDVYDTRTEDTLNGWEVEEMEIDEYA